MKQSPVLFLFFLPVLLVLAGCSRQAAEEPPKDLKDAALVAYLEAYADKEAPVADKLARSRAVLGRPESLPDTLYLKLLGQRAGLHRTNREMDSAVHYSQVQLQEAGRLQDSVYMAEAHFRLGFYHRSMDQYDASQRHYYQAVEAYKALGDSLNAGAKLLNLANLLNALGNYTDAENTAVEGLQYLEGSDRDDFKAGLYNALATATKELGNYEDAVAWYGRALELAENPVTRINVQNNIAITRLWQGRPQDALEVLSGLVGDSALAGNPRTQARVLDYLGLAQSRLGQDEALGNLQEALRIRQEIAYTNGEFISYQHLAEHFRDRDPQRARELAEKAYDLSQVLGNPDDRLSSLALLVETTPNPRAYALEYKRLSDSIQQYRQRAKDQFAKIRYESEKNLRNYLIAKEEASQSALSYQRARFRNIVMLLVLGVLVLGGYFLFRFLRFRHRKRELQAVYQTEKRISKKVHDELANDIFNLLNQASSKTVSELAEDTAFVDGLDHVYQKSRSISRDSGAIPTGKAFKEVLKTLIRSYSTGSVRVITKGMDGINWDRLGEERQVGLYRAIQELLVNMKKHSQASLVLLDFLAERKKLRVTYKDNGVGMRESELFSAGGIRNTENRIEALGGSFTFVKSGAKGTEFSVQLPY
ncbi:tetratricopeptide repeat-containing sensor histidine kinase [Robiginitalea sediminis]|uniref:tetratricopeptide repeat-containing sensor histidine kinase n=1 Tax=Robiginitalea sediminis TaxID=1982593 RepID=UPI000B4A665D|nr:tetratricopeptide repeat protein [Robiginitalea sediminis]